MKGQAASPQQNSTWKECYQGNKLCSRLYGSLGKMACLHQHCDTKRVKWTRNTQPPREETINKGALGCLTDGANLHCLGPRVVGEEHAKDKRCLHYHMSQLQVEKYPETLAIIAAASSPAPAYLSSLVRKYMPMVVK